jgi:DNA helicase II / ATP-dependent DNA helicase PcrA
MSTPDGLNTRSLFVVGDDAQSIYGFRGSKIEIILGFEKIYPNTNEIILNQNYRSNQGILDLAEQVLTHNPHQKKKALFTQRPDATKVKYYLARNEKDEAEFILRQIHQLYVEDNQEVTTAQIDPDLQTLKAEFSLEKLEQIAKK